MSAPASGPLRATCPLCRRRLPTFMHRRRRIFTHHTPDGLPHSGAVCDGSGWLVEDEDYDAAGVVGPVPAAWRRQIEAVETRSQ